MGRMEGLIGLALVGPPFEILLLLVAFPKVAAATR
jgi:hypothetical protein